MHARQKKNDTAHKHSQAKLMASQVSQVSQFKGRAIKATALALHCPPLDTHRQTVTRKDNMVKHPAAWSIHKAMGR